MVQLSVNVNKIATLRNSRGGALPSVTRAVETCLDAGAPGITVHPRADERHIRRADVTEIASLLAERRRARHSRRVQHRGRPAARSPRAGSRRPARPVHARAGDAGRDHESGRLAAGHRRRQSPSHRPRAAGRRRAREPVRRSGGGVRALGRGGRRRPHRALHRAVRAGVRARRFVRPREFRQRTPTRRASRTRSASASTPATISISTTCACSARSRTSTRSRSATRS